MILDKTLARTKCGYPKTAEKSAFFGRRLIVLEAGLFSLRLGHAAALSIGFSARFFDCRKGPLLKVQERAFYSFYSVYSVLRTR